MALQLPRQRSPSPSGTRPPALWPCSPLKWASAQYFGDFFFFEGGEGRAAASGLLEGSTACQRRLRVCGAGRRRALACRRRQASAANRRGQIGGPVQIRRSTRLRARALQARACTCSPARASGRGVTGGGAHTHLLWGYFRSRGPGARKCARHSPSEASQSPENALKRASKHSTLKKWARGVILKQRQKGRCAQACASLARRSLRVTTFCLYKNTKRPKIRS